MKLTIDYTIDLLRGDDYMWRYHHGDDGHFSQHNNSSYRGSLEPFFFSYNILQQLKQSSLVRISVPPIVYCKPLVIVFPSFSNAARRPAGAPDVPPRHAQQGGRTHTTPGLTRKVRPIFGEF